MIFGRDPTTGQHTKFRGVYVDDETPPNRKQGRDRVALELRGMIGKGGLVVIGIRPDEIGHQLPGCVSALEWYPWAHDFTPYPLPRAQAYITQKDYGAPPGRRPTTIQCEALYRRALAQKPSPRLVWTY